MSLSSSITNNYRQPGAERSKVKSHSSLTAFLWQSCWREEQKQVPFSSSFPLLRWVKSVCFTFCSFVRQENEETRSVRGTDLLLLFLSRPPLECSRTHFHSHFIFFQLPEAKGSAVHLLPLICLKNIQGKYLLNSDNPSIWPHHLLCVKDMICCCCDSGVTEIN